MTNSALESPGRHVVLFVEGRDRDESRHALETIATVDWSPGPSPEVVDVTQTRGLADWYGIVRFPAVVVVEDGMILAIEHECDPAACGRVVASAHSRGPLFGRRRW